jgi:hypothetical protein
MARDRIPRDVLEERLRRYVLKWREGEVHEVGEGVSGHVVLILGAELGPEFGEPEKWQQQVSNDNFLTHHERLDVYASLWGWVQAGILGVTASKQGDRSGWGGVYLTSHGRAVLQGESPVPEDVEDYLRRLKVRAPALDTTTLFYVEQALRAFRGRLYPAAAVMLGCASEHTVLQMAKALASQLSGEPNRRLSALVEDGAISAVWAEFRKRFEPFRKDVYGPHGMILMSETALDGLFLSVKRARDDGGHPRTVQLPEGEARALLQVFPEYAQCASLALQHFTT